MAGRRWRYRAAGFRRRLVADLLDLALLAAVSGGLWRLGPLAEPLPDRRGDLLDAAADFVAEDRVLLLPAAVATLFIGLAYGVLTRATLHGTLGERALGLRLIGPDAGPAGPLRACVHGLGTLLSLAPLGLGYTWALIDRDRRPLAEHLSGARLVRNRPEPESPRRGPAEPGA